MPVVQTPEEITKSFHAALVARIWPQSVYAGIKGYVQTQANYELTSDCILDLSHVAFFHSATFAADEASAATKGAEIEGNLGRNEIGMQAPQRFVLDVAAAISAPAYCYGCAYMAS